MRDVTDGSAICHPQDDAASAGRQSRMALVTGISAPSGSALSTSSFNSMLSSAAQNSEGAADVVLAFSAGANPHSAATSGAPAAVGPRSPLAGSPCHADVTALPDPDEG